MPITRDRRDRALHALQKAYDKLQEVHTREASRNNTIPVGGGEWMGSFFRMEGLRGTMTALRLGKGIRASIEEGKVVSEISIRIWNQRREWQVHRWDKCCQAYLDSIYRKIISL